MKAMSPAESFMYQHAGYSYDPKTETKRQGRIRCAKAYARAEAYATAAGWTTTLEDSPWYWGSSSSMTGDGDVPAPEYLYDAVLRDENGHMLGSLGMVEVNTPDSPYLRVVAAELALEAMPSFLRAHGRRNR